MNQNSIRPLFERRCVRALLVYSVVVCLAMIIYAAEGIRGTDQYQYVADVERLTSTGSVETNLHFPAKLLREQQAPTPTYISHNGPLLYVVSALNHILPANTAWVVLNTAYVTAALYLVSPIAIWQSANALQENYFAAILALCSLAYLQKERFSAKVALSVLLWLGAVSHPLFLVLSLFWFTWLLLVAIFGKSKTTALIGFVGLGGLVLISAQKTNWFPTSFQPSLSIIIRSVVPGQSNMLWHFAEQLPPLDVSLLLNKLSAATHKHFFDLKNSPFYIFTNLAVICIPLFLYGWKRYPRWVLPVLLCFGLYAAMIVLQQNHTRFQQIIAVAVFLVLAIAIAEIRRRFQKYWIVVGFVAVLLCSAISAIFAHHLHKDGEKDAIAIQQFIELMNALDKNDRVASINVWRHGPMTHLLRPRDYLPVRSKHLSNASMKEVFVLFKPTVVITQNYAIEDQYPEAELLFSTPDSLFGPISAYRVVP